MSLRSVKVSQKQVAPWLVFSLIAGVAIGAGVGIQLGKPVAIDWRAEPGKTQSLEILGRHSKMASDLALSKLDQVRVRLAQSLENSRSEPTNQAAKPIRANLRISDSSFIIQAELRNEKGQESKQKPGGESNWKITRSAKNLSSLWQVGIEAKIENWLNKSVNAASLGEGKLTLVQVKRGEIGVENDASAFVAMTPVVGGETGAVGFALVDGYALFGTLSGFKGLSEGNRVRTYLVDSHGDVLMHTAMGYAHADMGDSDFFKNQLEPTIKGKRISGSTESTSLDQSFVHAGYSRVGDFPFAVVVERVIQSVAPMSFSQLREQAILIGAAILMILSSLLVSVLGFQFSVARSQRKNAENGYEESDADSQGSQSRPETLVAHSPEVVAALKEFSHLSFVEGAAVGAGATIAGAPQFLAGTPPAAAAASGNLPGNAQGSQPVFDNELRAAQESLRAKQREFDLIDAFEKQAAHLKDPGLIATRMVELSSQLCGSPSLFFSYQPMVRKAVLSADAGLSASDSPVELSFQVDPALIERLTEAGKLGELISLSDYPPLAEILLSRLGIAYFEAWAITGYSHLGRLAEKPKLLGVLVVLQAGVESLLKKEALGRMVRATGLIYENAVLSR